MLWPLEGESNDRLERNSERVQQERAGEQKKH